MASWDNRMGRCPRPWLRGTAPAYGGLSERVYTASAPTGTEYAKFRPKAASSTALILVGGHEVASGAESPAVAVSHNVPVYVVIIPSGQGTLKEYSVTFSIPSASMDAGRGVTAAVDAALAVVGELSPEDAAGALLGERSLAAERLESLDRLGNANGPSGAGRARSPSCSPPRCGRATERAGRPRPRWHVPEPGYLSVEWTAAAGGAVAAGALVEINGAGIGRARAPGLETVSSPRKATGRDGS